MASRRVISVSQSESPGQKKAVKAASVVVFKELETRLKQVICIPLGQMNLLKRPT